MSDDFTYLINGIDLDTAFGKGFISNVSTWRPPVITRRTSLILPGEHGVVNTQIPVFDEGTVTIGLRLLEADQTNLEERVNHIRALFAQPQLTLGRKSGTASDTTATVQLVSMNDEDFLVGRTDRLLIVLALPGVFFRDPSSDSADIAFASDLTNVEIPNLSASTAPITDAVVRLTGPATAVSITDPLTGTGISWAGTLLAGQYLFLRGRPLMARISANAGDWSAGGSSELGNLDYPAAGRLQLTPVVQTSTVRKVLFSATGGGRLAGTTKLAFRARRSYL